MSEDMRERYAEIEARTNAASPGPWEPGDIWLTAGVIWDADQNRVGPKTGTRCTYCHLGEPVWSGRTDINGTRMHAHRHRCPDPYAPEHRISSAEGGTVAGNYDYEAGGILRAEDTAFIAHAREDVPFLLQQVDTLRRLLETALHIRKHGEHAPGGNENWRDWGRAAAAHLYPQTPGGES